MDFDAAILEAQEQVKHWEDSRRHLESLAHQAWVSRNQAEKKLKDLYQQQDEHLSRVVLYRRPEPFRDVEDCGLAVILLQTPAGMLVCRKRGEPHSDEMCFKFNRGSQKFLSYVAQYTYELREVPQEYIDRALAAADKAQQS
jgi:hypothetical protein